MAQVNPHIYDVHYTRPTSGTQSASKAVNYLSRRYEEKETDNDREDGQEPGRDSSWYTMPEDQQTGNAERFKEEAKRRSREKIESAQERGKDLDQDHSPGNVSYVHVVISPASRDEMSNEDFESLKEPWIRDRQGNVHEHYGAIHRDDPEGPKMHLLIARDRIDKKRELPEMKEQTAELIARRDREREQERSPGREQGQERSQEQHRESSRDRQRESGRGAGQRQQGSPDSGREPGSRSERGGERERAGREREGKDRNEKQYVIVTEYQDRKGKFHEVIADDRPMSRERAELYAKHYNKTGSPGGATYSPKAVEELRGGEGRRIKREVKRQQKAGGSKDGGSRQDDDRDLEM